MRIGVGRAEVTGFVPGVAMMGYAIVSQRAVDVAMPLYARALVVETGAQRVAFVVADLWGISEAVRQGVLEGLQTHHPECGLGEHEVMLTATHSHSGPGGYSHSLLYNMANPGFCHEVYEAVVHGILAAIVAAVERLVPGRLRLSAAPFPESEPVGFQRSIAAYNRNPEVSPVTPETAHRGIDRTMTLLLAEDETGRPLGAFSWFGVHGCSVASSNRRVHPDNKGEAARRLEGLVGEGFVAGFAQGAAGDVSPHDHRGRGAQNPADDFAGASENGAIQARHGERLLEGGEILAPRLRAVVRYADHGAVEIDPLHTGGRTGQTTAPAVLGATMMVGTADGPTGLYGARRLLPLLARLNRGARFRAHGRKIPFLELARGASGRAFGVVPQSAPPVPDFSDPIVANLKSMCRRGALDERPWVPQVLPAQLLVLGQLAIAGLPGEPTTVMAARLRETLLVELAPLGVEHVVINGYANAYAGYFTTREEYRQQAYEGASTLFGKWTAAAWCTRFTRLARDLVAGRVQDVGPVPERLSEAALVRQAWRRAEGSL